MRMEEKKMKKVAMCLMLCFALLLCCACESAEERMDRAFKSIDLPDD